MVGGVSPETCWASYKYEIKILIHCCILLDFLCELYYDARIHEHQNYIMVFNVENFSLLSRLRSVRRLAVLICIVFLPILFAYTTYRAEWWNSQLPVLHDLSYQISQSMLVDLVTNSHTISPHAFSVVGTLDIYHHSTSHMPTYDASLTAKE